MGQRIMYKKIINIVALTILTTTVGMNYINQPKVAEAKTIQVSDKTLGTLAELAKNPDFFKYSTDGSGLTYKIVPDNQGTPETKGYSGYFNNGSPAGIVWYKRIGNMVSVKFLDVDNAPSVAQAKIKEVKIPYRELIKKYYSTPEQRQEVDSFAKTVK